MRIGIFGGSFNPVHEGHLHLARHALDELNLDRVLFVPVYRSPLKAPQALLPAQLRVKLLRAALGKNPRFSVSLFELRKKRLSFTVDTLEYFRKKFGKGAVLYFLAGADTLGTLPRWRSPERVLRLCRFTVMTRPGYPLKAPRPLKQPVVHLSFDALRIASSEIRSRLRRGLRAGEGMPPRAAALLDAYYKKTRKRGIKKSNPVSSPN